MIARYVNMFIRALAISVVAVQGSMAQSCLPSGITLDHQSQVDSFPINYPGCVNVLAHMIIFPVTPGAITDLSPLSQITTIGGQLWINDNNALTSFQGLHNVTSVGSHLRIRYNSAVLDLNGLNSIKTVGGEMDISNNNGLEHLNGLDSVTSVGTNVIISNNAHLQDLEGLNRLTTIGGYLSIAVDTSIVKLNGIDSLDHTTMTNLQIVNCKHLFKCNVKSICDYLNIPTNPSTIGGNAFPCFSTTQIKNNCAAMTGVGETNKDLIKIYPNPASSFIAVTGTFRPDARVTVTDSHGQVLVDRDLGNGYVDIKHFPQGVYFVAVRTAESRSIRRVIKTEL